MQQSRVKIKVHFIMVKVSHNNVNVVIRISLLKSYSNRYLVGLRTFTTGEECTVSLSVFAGSERIPRRFSIFAEDPCKSTITTSEPCSPVFKEAQPRPSKHKHKHKH